MLRPAAAGWHTRCRLAAPMTRDQPSTEIVDAPDPGLRNRRVREVMRRDFISISQQESVLEALDLMRLARLRHITIANDGLLVGILSYRDLQDDLLARIKPPLDLHRELAIGHAAAVERTTGSPYSIAPDATLAEAAARLERLRVGCLPVVEAGVRGLQVVGLLTEMDLLRAAYQAR